jgi:DNA-binding response OmpR family regulator
MADSKHILVIDDDSSLRPVVCALLQKNGFTTTEARDGIEGLRAIDAQRPDLIVTDILMPDLDGLTLVKALKRRNETKGIPVVFLTAKSDPLSMIEGINVGAKYYITKPLQAEDFLGKIRKLLGGSGHRIG